MCHEALGWGFASQAVAGVAELLSALSELFAPLCAVAVPQGQHDMSCRKVHGLLLSSLQAAPGRVLCVQLYRDSTLVALPLTRHFRWVLPLLDLPQADVLF